MTKSFFESLDELVGLVESATPTDALFERIAPLLNDADVERQFWRILPNSDWVPVLRDAGRFDSPPDIQRGSDGTLIRFVPWGASQYFARIAAGAPRNTAEIIAKVFSDIATDNASVNGDMLDVALALPVEVAASLAERVGNASKRDALRFGYDKASELCERLASAGFLNEAIVLADALFTLHTNEDGKLFSRSEDEYWYVKGLERVAPVLAIVNGREFCSRLCNWVAAAVTVKRQFGDSPTDEYSYVWRPAIEDDEQNSEGDFTSGLVTISRDTFEKAIRSGSQMSLADAVGLLQKQVSQVLRRLQVHLARVFAERDSTIARSTMMDRHFLEGHAFKHEYALLMHDCWKFLSDDEKATWLDWVDSIVNDIKVGQGWDNDQPEERAAWWEYERLHWIRDHLAGDRRVSYEEMNTKFGEPELAGTNVRFGPMRWGSESPFTVEDLKEHSFADAVQLIASWVPDVETDSSRDREGLANIFGQYLTDDAAGFSRHATLMEDRPPIYVRTFLSKMEEAIKNNREVDLSSVLSLCDWVVAQPATARTDEIPDDLESWDRTWQWSRDEVARLAEAVCKARFGGEPTYSIEEFRERIWRLIEPLTKDIAVSNISSDRSDEDSRTHDYVGHAINSPRGRALEAAFEYARWVARTIAVPIAGGTSVPKGMGALPEFQSMLEWQIDVANATVEASAIIGMHLGLLHWIDKEWLDRNISTIFLIQPYEGGRDKECGWAAWNAFLVWVAPHIVFYKFLKSQYAYAVEETASIEVTERSREQPVFRLGEHLMILYGRGHLPLGEEGGLMRRFLERANPKVRQRAFSFIGWSFRREAAMPQEIVDRFMAIWDFYWKEGGKVDAGQADEDLFGRWFSTAHFPNEWSLDRLEEYVEVGKTVEADNELLNRLANIASTDIAKSVSILSALVGRDREGWNVRSWSAQATKILEVALSGSEDVREKARTLIDHLGRRGFLEFGELLKAS